MLVDTKTANEVILPRNPSFNELQNTREILCPSTKYHAKFYQLQTRARIKTRQ